MSSHWTGQIDAQRMDTPTPDDALAAPPCPADGDQLMWDVLESPAPEGALLPVGFEAAAVRA